MFEYLVFYDYIALSTWSREIRIERVGDSIQYRIKRTDYYGGDRKIAEGEYEGESDRFIEKLEGFHVEEWPLCFFQPVLDGHAWNLRYKEVGKPCRKIEGSNAFPECYPEFISLLESVVTGRGIC